MWAEQDAVTLDALLEQSLPDMIKCMSQSPRSIGFTFANFSDDELASDPPSQEPLVPSDTTVILDCYPRSQTLFTEQELVSLLRVGLGDIDIMDCVEHGFGKLSIVETPTLDGRPVRNPNPVDATCRVAAHMSGVDFAKARDKWFSYNEMGDVPDKDRDPGLKQDAEHQYFCKALMMIEKAAACVILRVVFEFASLHAELVHVILKSNPNSSNTSAWMQSDHAFQV